MNGFKFLQHMKNIPFIIMLIIFIPITFFLDDQTIIFVGTAVLLIIKYSTLLWKIWNGKINLFKCTSFRVATDLMMSLLIPISISFAVVETIAIDTLSVWDVGIFMLLVFFGSFAILFFPLPLQKYVNNFVKTQSAVNLNKPQAMRVKEKPNLAHTIDSSTKYAIDTSEDSVTVEVPINNSEVIGRVYPNLHSCIKDLYEQPIKEDFDCLEECLESYEEITVDDENKSTAFHVDTSSMIGGKISVESDIKDPIKPYIGERLLSDPNCFIDEATIVTHTI